MPKLYLVQIGEERSIVLKYFPDTKESKFMIIDNSYLMQLDEMGLVK